MLITQLVTSLTSVFGMGGILILLPLLSPTFPIVVALVDPRKSSYSEPPILNYTSVAQVVDVRGYPATIAPWRRGREERRGGERGGVFSRLQYI